MLITSVYGKVPRHVVHAWRIAQFARPYAPPTSVPSHATSVASNCSTSHSSTLLTAHNAIGCPASPRGQVIWTCTEVRSLDVVGCPAVCTQLTVLCLPLVLLDTLELDQCVQKNCTRSAAYASWCVAHTSSGCRDISLTFRQQSDAPRPHPPNAWCLAPTKRASRSPLSTYSPIPAVF